LIDTVAKAEDRIMKIHIRERNVTLTPGLRTHVEQRLGVALGRFGEVIGRVLVRFSGATGDGAKHQRCEIKVGLRPRNVHVEDTDPDLLLAIDRATDRVSRLVGRTLERERDLVVGRVPVTSKT
jgi:putative sigma-54 modulation protein